MPLRSGRSWAVRSAAVWCRWPLPKAGSRRQRRPRLRHLLCRAIPQPAGRRLSNHRRAGRLPAALAVRHAGKRKSARAPNGKRISRSAAAASGKRPVWSDPVPDGGAPTPAAAGWIWSQWTWTQWILWGGMPTVALAAAVSVWIWSSKHPRPSIEAVAAATPVKPPDTQSPEPVRAPEPVEDEAIPLDRRWIPRSAQGLLSFSLQRLVEQPVGRAAFYHLGEVWSRGVQPLFARFKLAPAQNPAFDLVHDRPGPRTWRSMGGCRRDDHRTGAGRKSGSLIVRFRRPARLETRRWDRVRFELARLAASLRSGR